MILEIWRGANLLIAFLLELVAVAALGFLGARGGRGRAGRLLCGIAAAVVAMLFWGLFAAPESTFDVPVLAVLTKIAVFGGAAIALHRLGHRHAALIYPVVVLANLGFVHLSA
ncbi:YrdB family protein [Nocardia yamanashiensis]|uniref:YrdB family protein n=1 Tax=Nocardia yamanashiensis TaxID=209247 RepID=UPI001E550A14|nr:YrdB family protein [Nocardia yamanashiensis]UGT45511.1 YrdB family protein [Nocardia yamanashiensis]